MHALSSGVFPAPELYYGILKSVPGGWVRFVATIPAEPPALDSPRDLQRTEMIDETLLARLGVSKWAGGNDQF